MSATPGPVSRARGLVVTTLLGVVFFNALIGVFSLSEAIIALVLFVSLAIVILRRPQTSGTQP
jgi:glucose uptake protein GlcU